MTEKWSTEELDASVAAYIQMRDMQERGEKYTKKSFYEELSKRFGRTEKSYEYRMQNISYVYSVLGRRWIEGLKPARNVGSNVVAVLERLIQEREGSKQILDAAFESEVDALRKKNVPAPTGRQKPEKISSQTTSFVRDPNVVAWVLNNSQGVCESCGKPSPFEKNDGSFYLEVHHLKRLADGGTDTIKNAVAVCPNCHRELHYGKHRDHLLRNLYASLERLVLE
jgi:5-methylcytosine-specific restriction protein A